MKAHWGVKFIVLLCIAVSVLLICSAAAAETGIYGVTVPTGSGKVKLHAAPDAKSGTVAVYTDRAWFEYMDENSNWIHVSMTDGNEGYILKKQLSIASMTECISGEVDNPQGTSLLNLRLRPEITSPSIAQFSSGIPCVIISISDGWYNVKINGLTGFFYSDFVKTYIQPVSDAVATLLSESKTVPILSGPGADYEAVGTCSNGDKVMLLNNGNDYCEIATHGIWGFVNSDEVVSGIIDDEAIIPYSDLTAASVCSCYIYSSASTASSVVESVPAGRNIVVEASGKEWCMVLSSAGKLSYIQTDCLKFAESETSNKKVSHPDGTFVNMRKSASLSSDVLEKISHGVNVTVLIPGTEWTKVSYRDKTGYMMSVYLK